MMPVDILNFTGKIIEVLAWPIIVLTFILLFRNNLSNMIDRIRFMKHKDTVIGFSEYDLIEVESHKAINQGASDATFSLPPEFPVDKPATLFWLANDLMWLQDVLYRDAPSWSVIEGLKNSQKYVKSLGLKGSLADSELNRLLRETQAIVDSGLSSWSPEFRLSLVRQIETIKWYLSAHAEDAEPGFKKHRVFPSKKKGGQ